MFNATTIRALQTQDRKQARMKRHVASFAQKADDCDCPACQLRRQLTKGGRSVFSLSELPSGLAEILGRVVAGDQDITPPSGSKH